MKEILNSVLPLLGVVVGIILTHLFARSKDRQSQLTTFRQEAYADYLRAVSAVAIGRTPASVGQLIDAKARMAIYASDEVIDHLAEFEATGMVLSDASARTSFTKLADQMRSDNGIRASKQDALAIVLFGASKASGATKNAA